MVGSNVKFDADRKELVIDASDQKHHICNQMNMKDGKGVSKNREIWQVLLDNQSTCNVAVSEAFLKNVRTRD